MKIKIILISLALSVSCTNKNKTDYPINFNQVDYKKIEQENHVTSIDSTKRSFLDTLNTHESPVQIISSKLSNTDYSNHKDIQLTYKNVSKNNVKAIKFEWYCENAFEKPANGRYYFVKGKSDGISNTLLKPKETRSQVWEDFSTDANKIIKARVYFVLFSNGKKWELKKKCYH